MFSSPWFSGGDAFTTFALHPSGHELVTVGRSTLLRVWDLQTGTTCQTSTELALRLKCKSECATVSSGHKG